MLRDTELDNRYDEYFGRKPTALIPDEEKNVLTNNHIHQNPKDGFQIPRLTAEGNINNIDDFFDLLRKILNAAWGHDWGHIGPSLKKMEDSKRIPLPQVIYSVNSRDSTVGRGVKPRFMDQQKEVLNGKETGDYFLIYRHWVDCVIEVNFIAQEVSSARKIMNDFEALILAYSGFLKQSGISEIMWLRETTPTLSNNYVEGYPQTTDFFMVRLETISKVRASTLVNISREIFVSDPLYSNSNTTEEDLTSLVLEIARNSGEQNTEGGD